MGAKRKKNRERFRGRENPGFTARMKERKKKDPASIKGCECSEGGGGPPGPCEMTSSMFLPKLRLLGDGLGPRRVSESSARRPNIPWRLLGARRRSWDLARPPAGAVTPRVRRCSSWLLKASSLWIAWPNLNPNKRFGDAMNCYLYHCGSAEILRGSELAEEFLEFQQSHLVSPLFRILNPVRNGLMTWISTHHCYIIVFSVNYIM